MRVPRPAAAVRFGVLAVVGLAACGASPPVSPRRVRRPWPPSPARAIRPSPGAVPIEEITRFTEAYINWTASDVSRQMAMLARTSIGQARSEMMLAAAETSGDGRLRQGGIANQGQVEAVAPLHGHPGQYVVVTRETTTASATAAYQGLAPAWHLTIATVTVRVSGNRRRWVISGWQPES